MSENDRTPKTASSPSARILALKPYSIGAAARLAGVPPETVRIWERRYGLLRGPRTEGGHRVYSEDDVALLRAVKSLVDGGQRISAVASMAPAEILREAGDRSPATSTLEQAASTILEDAIDAARALDERRLNELLDRPLLLSSAEDVCQYVYLPLLQRVGELWHAGKLSVGAEHFVEKMVTTRMQAMLQQTPQPQGGAHALLACPPGERHEVGLLASALALKRGGVAITFLGADLPAADLEAAVEATAPSSIVMAVTNDPSPEAISTLVPVLLRAPCADIPLLLGGLRATRFAALLRERDLVQVLPDCASVVAPARLAGA